MIFQIKNYTASETDAVSLKKEVSQFSKSCLRWKQKLNKKIISIN